MSVENSITRPRDDGESKLMTISKQTARLSIRLLDVDTRRRNFSVGQEFRNSILVLHTNDPIWAIRFVRDGYTFS